MQSPWYLYGRIDNYGQFPDPDGWFPKPDSNILAPSGTPITSLASGTVSGINTPWYFGGGIPTFGQVVTVKLDNPLNNIATHMAYLHLASVQPGLHIGQRVGFGDILGYAGANPQNAATGFALYNDDFYGYGPTWSRYVGSPQLNPVPFLNSLQTGNGGSQRANDLNSTNLVNFTSGNTQSPPNNTILGFDFTRFINAGLLFIVGIVLVIVGGMLIMNKGINDIK